MKKYFIYGFIITWTLTSVFFYQNYQNKKQQKIENFNSRLLYDFNIAKELFNSKLNNLYFKEFDSFIIRKTINNMVNEGDSLDVLETLITTKFHKYKNLLNNLIYYDNKGELLFSLNQTDIHDVDLNSLRSMSFQNETYFEYYNNENRYYVKIQQVKFQGSITGYVKQIVSFDTFMGNYLNSYDYKILRSDDIIENKRSTLALEAINSDHFFALQIKNNNNLFKELYNTLVLKIVLSGIITAILLYILYIRLKKENELKKKIRWQKEFLTKVIDTSPNPIFVKDKNKRYIMANNATANLFKLFDSDLLIGKTNEELFNDQKTIQSIDKDEDHALITKEVIYRQIQKIENKYFKFVLIPLHNLEYPVNEEMLLGFATNITNEIERKNKLADLNTKLKLEIFEEMSCRLKINEKFKKIFDNINDGMFICKIDKRGKLSEFIDINTAGIKLINSYECFSNKTPGEIFDKFKFKLNEHTGLIELEKPSYKTTLSDGTKEHTVKISCHIVLIKNIYNAVIFVQDINETVKLKKEKKQQQVLIANIFKKAKSAIAVIDKDGKFVKYNQSFYKTLGYHRNHFKNANFYSIFKHSDLKNLHREHLELFKSKKDLTKEYSFVSKGQTTIDAIGSSTLIRDANKQTHRLFIFEDITKQKELENDQEKNNKILAQQAKMAEMGEMIGAIAHQWRQPLNAINAAAIKLNLATTLGLSNEEEIQEKTKFIEQQSIRMSETINDFLNFFNPSNSKESFQIDSIYQKIYNFLEPQLKNRDITIELKSDKKMEVFGFKNEFEHILLNLINNAKDAFEEKDEIKDKRITVLCSENEKYNTVKVIDNAGGIPQSILNKVFNPYFTTKEQGKGTGIGLYMTKTIIEKHFKGKISVTNNEEGAEFCICLPKEEK